MRPFSYLSLPRWSRITLRLSFAALAMALAVEIVNAPVAWWSEHRLDWDLPRGPEAWNDDGTISPEYALRVTAHERETEDLAQRLRCDRGA